MRHPSATVDPHKLNNTGQQPAVTATHLNRSFGSGATKVKALDDVSIQFRRGGFTAIMGPSGSGKSTLLQCLAGLDAVDSGSILVGDTEITDLGEADLTRVRRDRFGFVFQAFNLIQVLNAADNIRLPLDLAGRRTDPDWFDHIVVTLGLQDRLTHRPQELSGGEQQRVAIARALISRPDVVFADEPTGNLDSQSSTEVLALLSGSVRQTGQTIIMVTHDAVVASFADRAVVLRDGRIAADLEDASHTDLTAVMTAGFTSPTAIDGSCS